MPSALRGAPSVCQHERVFCCAVRHCVEGLALLSARLPQRLAALSDNTLLLMALCGVLSQQPTVTSITGVTEVTLLAHRLVLERGGL